MLPDMRKILTLLLLALPLLSVAQYNSFPYGRITYAELNMRVYDRDTSARAVVLEEFGEAYIDNGGNHNLIFEHHFKIKILKKSGLDLSNFSIPLIKYSSQNVELLRDVKASSFSIVDGRIKESKLENKNIFTENYENGNIKKFAIPNVSVGSVIEIQYTIEKPNLFNFKKWEFQSDIPKIKSEYWALIPANYTYNIALKGFLELSRNESELVKDCFMPGGGNKADCSRLKFAMENIPAFAEEEFMTTSKNYIASINFELSEIKYFTGAVDKITKEWKDVEEELRREQRFGLQLKRGKEILGSSINLAGQTDALSKAKIIYDFVVDHYTWNGEYGKYCENGIKKAFEARKGNVGDINLSLIAALRYAGLEADPVILSTRDHGYATELYPVLSDFNYVIARLTINNKNYLLDATDPLLPFGMVPLRCLNGKGRVIGDRQTSWQDISPDNKFKKISLVQLKLDDKGGWKGMIQNVYTGYEAYSKRKEILSFGDMNAYQRNANRDLNDFVIEKMELKNLDNFSEPLTETFEGEITGVGEISTILFNPFFGHKRSNNPFKSSERLYPVDFGATTDERITVTLELPGNVEIVNLPERVALGLPNAGGRFIFDAKTEGNSVVISSWLNISRAYFTSDEYHYLKELFSRIVQLQNTDIILRKG